MQYHLVGWISKDFADKKHFCFDCPVMSCKENVGHCCFPQCPALFLRVFPFSICILHHSCTLEIKIEDCAKFERKSFEIQRPQKLPLVPKSSAVLCHCSCAHRSNIYIPLPCCSCRFCLVFFPELYVESLFVFHIELIQWSICMFVRSVM